MDPFAVKVARGVRVGRENAPTPDARGAMGHPESKLGWVNDSPSPTDQSPGMV